MAVLPYTGRPSEVFSMVPDISTGAQGPDAHPGSALGRKAEELAAAYFVKRGFRVLDRGYRTKLGEIDIVLADSAECIVFVEVKARSTDRYGLPQEAVTRRKQLQIVRTAMCYIQERGISGRDIRFDILSISFKDRRNPVFEHLPRAFDGECWESS